MCNLSQGSPNLLAGMAYFSAFQRRGKAAKYSAPKPYAACRVAEAQPTVVFLVIHAAVMIRKAFSDPRSPEC